MIFSLSEKGHHAGTSALVPEPPNAPVDSISSVRAPSRAAAAAAVQPVGPPPDNDDIPRFVEGQGAGV